ncbi:MAG: S-layer family protein, partial [Symploca sp. SIO1A3]|nr:S-layer family protein [Symploca sp. SIO1A3]
IGTSADGQISSSLFFDASGTGDAGDLKITTERLTVREGGRVSASTSDAGRGGTLDVNASKLVEVIGTSADGQISSSLFFDASGTGDAGNLKITTERLTVQDGGRVSASTSDAGRGGTLDVNASESVEVIGTSADGSTPSRLFFDSSGAGDAGELAIATTRLVVRDGGEVSASTSGDGNAGILDLKASESVEVIGTSADGSTPSRLFFDSSGAGDAGELAIATRRLIVRDGGQVSAATSATGRGGIFEVNASESIEVSGSSGSFASGLFFDSRGAGDARGIKIDTGRLVVENGGQITVSGTGTGTSGDLEIAADSIFLNNQGRLRATTAASEGGNIRLQVANSIIMRHNSEISAEAFGTAKGGNITMEVGDFIIALLPENSDIVASAFQGQGGNISAEATGIFGFRQFQGVRTPESDFTATSELGIDGTLEVITRDNLRLEGLSDDFLNDKDQPTQGCQAFGSRSSAKFYNLGRGGLPTNPYEPLGSDDILEDVQPPTQGSENSAEADTSFTTPPETIVEAQGWMITDKGEVILVAQMPVPLSQNFCHLR